MWGRFDDFLDQGEGDAAFYSIDRNAHPVTGRRQRDHQSAPIGVREAQTAGQDAFDRDFHFDSEEKQTQPGNAEQLAQPLAQEILVRFCISRFVHVSLVRLQLLFDLRAD